MALTRPSGAGCGLWRGNGRMTSSRGGVGETRTLRPLALPARAPGGGAVRRGLFVDCETTGRSAESDVLIELALLPFAYTLDGVIAQVLGDEAQVHRNDPGRPRRRRPRGRAPLRARTSSSPTTRGSTARSSRPSCPPPAQDPGRARAPRSPGPKRASRARPFTASFAPAASSPATGTGRSPTARPACGSSPSASPSRAAPSSPPFGEAPFAPPRVFGPSARRSTRRRRFAPAATGGCPRCETASSARGGPT